MPEKFEPKLGDEIPENVLKKSENELKSDRKSVFLSSFRGKDSAELVIHKVTSGIESFGSEQYAVAFSRLIVNSDLKTRKQMSKILKDKNIWGEEQEKRLETLYEYMHDVELTVAKMRQRKNFNKASMNKIRSKWEGYRKEINELISEKTQLLSNTIEGRSEEEEIKAKLSLCIKFPDGERVWGSLEALNDESDRNAVLTIVNEALIFWSGLTQEIIRELPAKLVFGGEETLEPSQET